MNVQVLLHTLAPTLNVQYVLHIVSAVEQEKLVPKFTPGELMVMQLLWEHGEMKPAQLQELFPESIKNPALRSYLSILLEKGHVSRRKVGKAYFYRARTARHSAFRTTLRELVDGYCDGSVQSLIMNLIRSEKLSEHELIELKQLAEEEPAASSSKKPSRKRKAE